MVYNFQAFPPPSCAPLGWYLTHPTTTFPSYPLITLTPHPPSLNCTAPAPADWRTSTLNKLSVTLVFSLQFSSCTSVTAVNCVRHLTAADLKPPNSSIFPAPSVAALPSPLQHIQPGFPGVDTWNHPLWLWKAALMFFALSHPVPWAWAVLLHPKHLPWAPSSPHCAWDCQREILTHPTWPPSTAAISTLQRNHLYLCPHWFFLKELQGFLKILPFYHRGAVTSSSKHTSAHYFKAFYLFLLPLVIWLVNSC